MPEISLATSSGDRRYLQQESAQPAHSLFFLGLCEEQALVARLQDKGLVVITGCGHPTVEVILKMIRRLSGEPLYAIAGGLHFPVTESRFQRYGIQWVKYSGKPVTLHLAYYNDIVPSTTVTLPLAYLIPPEWDDVIARLTLHDVAISRPRREATVKVRTYRFSNIGFQPGGPYEGRQMCRFDIEATVEECTFPAETAIVDTAQRAARVIAHLLEPQAPDSDWRSNTTPSRSLSLKRCRASTVTLAINGFVPPSRFR